MPTQMVPPPVLITTEQQDGGRRFDLPNGTTVALAYPSLSLYRCWNIQIFSPDSLDIATVTAHDHELNNVVQMFGRIIAKAVAHA